MANFQIGFSGKLLYKETIESIKKDLSKISTGINKDSKLQLVAKLNTNNTIKLIQQQLDQISSKGRLKISADLDFLKNNNTSFQFKNLQNASKATAQSFSQVKSNIQGSVAEINTLIKKEERFNAERVKVGATETYQTGLGKTTKINYSAGEETSSVIVTDLKQANKFQEQLNEKAAKYIRNIKAAHEINKDTNSSRSVSQEENVQKLNAQYDEVIQKVEQYKNSTLETVSQNKIALEDEIRKYETLAVELKNVEQVAQNLKPISITSAKTDTINQLNTFLAQIDSQALKTGQDFSELKQKAIGLQETLSNATTPTDLQTVKETFSNLKTELQSLQANAKLNLDTTQATISADTLKNRVITLQRRIDIWLKNNPKAAKAYASQLLEIKNALGQIDTSAVGANKEITNLNSKFNSITRTANMTGDIGKGFFTNAKEKITKFAGWYGITGLIMSTQRLLTNSVDTVVELDSALVDLEKTTNANSEELENFYYNSNDIAKQLGVTTESVIQAAADWSRLGYSIKEAQKMANNSSIFTSISPGVDINKATDGLVSTMKAFDISADDSLDGIISKINIIGNTQGVSNGDIIDFLERSSASMSEANNTLEETIALGTAATEITRDASAVGNMLKTVSMRIRGYDEETETYTGDVEVLSGKIADLTKTAQNPTGISLFKDKDKTEFKSTVQLLRDIHKIYGDLTDKQQAGLLEALAGKRQGQGVAAILNNFDAVEKSLKTMENSAGNAMEEMDVIKKSTAYHINAFKETLTGIFQNSWGRDTINNVVDFGTKILNIVDTLTDKFGLLGGVIAPIITAVLSIKNKGIFKYDKDLGFTRNFKSEIFDLPNLEKAKNEVGEISKVMRGIQGDNNLSNEQKQTAFTNFFNGLPDDNRFKEMAQDFDILKGSVDKFSEESLVNLYANQIKNTQGFVGVRSAIASYNDACKKGEEESDLVAKAIGKTNTSLGDHLTACNGAKTSMAKYAGELAWVQAKQLLVRASTMALNMVLTMGVSTVLSLVFGAFDKLIVTEEELSDKAEELKSKYEETTSAIKDNLKTVEGFSDEFKKLSEGVDSQGKNISLTSEQYNRYKEIVKQLIEINPNLMTGYNNEHEALINNNNALQKTIDLLKEKSRLQEVEFSSDDNLRTFTKNIMQDVKSAQEFIDNFNSNTTNRQTEIAGESLLQGLSTQRFSLGVNSFTGNAKRQYEEINKILEVNKTDKRKADEMMYQFLVDNRDSFGMIESQYDEYTKDMTSWAVSIKKNLDTYNNSENTVYDGFEKIRENIKHVLYSYDNYDEMSPGAKNFLEGYVENLKFDPKSSESEIINKVLEYKEEILLMLKDIDDSKISDEFKKIFEIDTSKTTVNDYTKQVDEIVKNIAKTDFAKKNNLTENDIKISLGLSIKTDDGNVKDKMAELRNDIKKQLSEQFGESEAIDIKVDSLTVDELKALDGIDFSQYKTLDEAITHAAKEAHKFDLSSYKDDIDNVQERVSKLSSALEKLKSGDMSNSDLLDFLQEFPELSAYANDTDRLQQAIQKLIQTEPNDLISQLQDLKKTLKTDEEVEQVDNLIKILQKLGIVSSKKDAKTAESTGKTKEELANEYLELQEKKIDNIIDKIEDRKKAEEKVLDSMQKEKDAMEEQLKILQEEKEEIEEKEEKVSKKVSEYETAGNTAISFLDDKIQELNDAKDALEKSYDDEIKNTQDKYNDEIDALKEKNDAINRSIELKKAEDELYNARNTKVRVYSEAGGFEEQVNASDVREKEQNLSSLKRGYKIEDLESERDKAVKKIETDKENDSRLAQYEKDIKAYEDYKKSFEDMVNSYERNQNNLTAARILGTNWHERVTNQDIGLIQRYGKEYNGYQIQLNEDIPKEIEAKEHAIEEQEKVIENQDNAIQKQQEVIDKKDEEIQSWNEYKDELSGAVQEIEGTNDDYVTSLDNVVLSEKSSYEDRVREAKKFKQTIIGILGSNDTNEVNGLADDYLNSDDSKTSSKKSSKKSEKKYELYYTDSEGKKHTLDTFSDNISAINYKMNMITDYADRYVGHAKSLNKRFGIKLTDDANEYGIRQALSNTIKIKAYAKGGINDFTGLAMMHGTKQKSEVVFNSADAKKLYDFVHTSNNLPEMLMNNVSNSIAKMFSEITTKMGQNTEFNSNSSSKSTSITIQINNPNIQADNYEQFERCMSQYITKQKLDTWVGK